MYERILRQMRERIRTRRYVMTVHGEEEMANDGFSIFDVERVILSGQIIERQLDGETDEWKFLISGLSEYNERVVVVGKISITDKLVIITVYRAD